MSENQKNGGESAREFEAARCRQCEKCCIANGIPAEYAESDVCPVMRWTWGAKVPACSFLGTMPKKEKKP